MPPSEPAPLGKLYIMQRGFVLYAGRVLGAGKVWGEDALLLSNPALQSTCIARASARPPAGAASSPGLSVPPAARRRL